MLRPFHIAIVLALLSVVSLRAQTFPVQLSVQLVPPFSGYLNDYSSPGNDNLRVFILFTDFSQPSYQLKLKFKLTGNNVTIQSKSWYYAGPFTVEPGVPLMLSGTDLSGLLNSANLDYSGINLQQYNQSKVLPEGLYTLSVTAYDFANPLPIVVSNEASTQAWMMLCDPPITNLPTCGSELTITTVQQVTFSWSPLNMSAPTSALGTEYLFELWEVMPPTNAPGNVVLTTAPIYSTTTSQTLLNYGLTEPPLQVGWTYVWRVRAYDLDGRELFRNNGYSVICTFSWGNENNLLGNLANLTLSAQVLTHRQARCMWDSTSVYASYHFEFRKLNTPNWFPVNTNNSNVRITSLEPLTSYEAQVHGIFPNGSDGPWSNIVTFTTPAQAVLNCGESSPPPSQQNFSPLAQATTGMLWQIGQFEMVVTQLNNPSSANGLYSGLGKMILPLGVTVACTFTNIQIGTDQIMYAGEVKAITEGVSAWLTQWQSTFNSYEAANISMNTNLDSVYLNNLGQIILVDENGNTTTIENPSNGNNNVIITDSNGDVWIIDPNGNITIVNAQISNIIKLALIEIDQESENLIAQHNQSLQTSVQLLDNARDSVSSNVPPDIDFGFVITDTTTTTLIPSSEIQFSNQYHIRTSSSIGYFSQSTLDEMSEVYLQNNTWAELAVLTVNNVKLLDLIQSRISAGDSQNQLVSFTKLQIENYVKSLTYHFMYSK